MLHQGVTRRCVSLAGPHAAPMRTQPSSQQSVVLPGVQPAQQLRGAPIYPHVHTKARQSQRVAALVADKAASGSTQAEQHRPLKVLIAGAGIGGLVLAVALIKQGVDVVVFERDMTAIRGEGKYRGPIQVGPCGDNRYFPRCLSPSRTPTAPKGRMVAEVAGCLSVTLYLGACHSGRSG